MTVQIGGGNFRVPTPMRLSKLRTGHGVRQKFLLGLTSVLTLSEPFDVVKTFTYRPEILWQTILRSRA